MAGKGDTLPLSPAMSLLGTLDTLDTLDLLGFPGSLAQHTHFVALLLKIIK